MLYRVKNFWLNLTRKNLDSEYKLEIVRLKEKVNNLQELVGDPKFVVDKVLGRDLAWYDYKQLKAADRVIYWQNAQAIIKNDTFKNEIKHTCSDLINEIAKESKSFKHVIELRMTINGLMLLKDRFEDISSNDDKPKNTEPFKEV